MNVRLQLRNTNLARGGRPVLSDVSLSVHAGQVLGIIGPNGAGKSTALRLLAGLQRPDSGEVLFDGQRLLKHPEGDRARQIGYLEQGATVHWPLTVRAVVELGRLPWRRGWFSGDDQGEAAVHAALQAADLEAVASRMVSELSGGEAMRVMMARVLAADPRIILADEPVAALDVRHQLQLMNLLAERAASGAAVVVVLHDLVLARRFCDRVVLMKGGRVVRDGTAREVLEPGLLETVYGVRMQSVEPAPGVSVPIPW